MKNWFSKGDWNAFFGLAIDNLAVMVTLFGLLTMGPAPFSYTPEFILAKMLPGTALGVLAGDLVYTFMALRMAKLQNRTNVTAMPLGLDTPSTFGMAFLVLLPALSKGNELFPGDHQKAMTYGWHVGLMTLLLIGAIKVLFSPFGNLVRKWVPRAGLLGSLAAIALTLISFMPLREDIAGIPLVGLPTLWMILVILLAHRVLPRGFPGALLALLVGLFIYTVCLFAGPMAGVALVPPFREIPFHGHWGFQIPWVFANAESAWWNPVISETLMRLPTIFPFALATIVGGIDCTESAASAGDDYDTRKVLFTEAISTLVAGAAGGVIQTTPYIGQPAYKSMGARSGYTLLTALFIGVAGFMGGLTIFFEVLPKVVLFPILIFVGLEITSQTFRVVPRMHYPALALSMLPAVAYVALLLVKSFYAPAQPQRPDAIHGLLTLRCLANGFLITGMMWAAIMSAVLDDRLKVAAVYSLIAAVFAFFGIMHSPLGDETIGLPWNILKQLEPLFHEAISVQTPWHWAGGYLVCAGLLWAMACFSKPPENIPGLESDHQEA